MHSFLLAAALLAISTVAKPFNTRASATPRCIPGQSCFPTVNEINAFNASLDGQMFSQRPIEAYCYLGDPLFNLAKCSNYTTNFLNLQYLTENSQTYEVPTWETCGIGNSCQLTSGSLPVAGQCKQGNVPNYAVEAQTQDDVVKFMNFASKYNLRIAIKNTGHDYQGRSAGRNTVMLWLHKMKEMNFAKSYIPQGCDASSSSFDSVKLGAGAQWGDVYEFAHQFGYMVVGGDANSVGASGGWGLGGGHSFLTPNYGLGVDNMMEATVVLPTGDVKIANECQNTDLFWAIRGGGGPSFGVVTEMVFKAHKEVPMGVVNAFSNGLSFTQSNQQALIEALAEIAPALGNAGFGGSLELFGPVGLVIQGIVPNKTADEVKALFAPMFNKLLAINKQDFEAFVNLFQFSTQPTWYDYGKTAFSGNRGSGFGLVFASRIIPAATFNNPSQLADKMIEGLQQGALFFSILAVGGNNTGARAGNDPTKTSVTPAWDTAVWHVIYFSITTGNQPGSSIPAAAYKTAHDSAEILRQYLPDSGAYLNESDLFEDDPPTAFWGQANYQRLLTIKRQVDPQNLLNIWHGVGWVENGGTSFETSAPDGGPYSCYPTIS
ncbi:FAD-binding domain-containing protein [Meira miltonrushii]|uniref:FAD-binding domain-containing protein n=1 Tax=Meira miltonrushii TaxID=1280837 RepID=A0A316V5C3_9BASI|nr:FAD-binding domain-containing protein [Meira miltonrushii]PWN31701.1 FAD-binding domain-containing protein [Meira miltonrushii]